MLRTSPICQIYPCKYYPIVSSIYLRTIQEQVEEPEGLGQGDDEREEVLDLNSCDEEDGEGEEEEGSEEDAEEGEDDGMGESLEIPSSQPRSKEAPWDALEDVVSSAEFGDSTEDTPKEESMESSSSPLDPDRNLHLRIQEIQKKLNMAKKEMTAKTLE